MTTLPPTSRSWIIAIDCGADGHLDAITSGHRPTAREATEDSITLMENDGDVISTLVIEDIPHVTRSFEGLDSIHERRYRLAAQAWRRADGHIDQHLSAPSESPWGSVA
jgi:hypothetical protein